MRHVEAQGARSGGTAVGNRCEVVVAAVTLGDSTSTLLLLVTGGVDSVGEEAAGGLRSGAVTSEEADLGGGSDFKDSGGGGELAWGHLSLHALLLLAN